MQPARTLDQILAELDPVYTPQVNNIRQRQALIPGQIADEEKGLDAKKTSAFDSILGGARQRGLGFSGIPLAEQAKYTSTDYLPALARLRTQGREQAMSLEDAILGINERKQTTAMGQRQYEQSRYDQYQAEQRRLEAEKEAQRRAAAASAGSGNMLASLFGGQKEAAPASFQQRQGGGFNFSDNKGNPISAAKYASLTGQDIRTVLYKMGQSGDNYSQQLYNQLARDPFFARGDAKYDQRIYQAYKPIFWGL
jgi:hypothetical protein